MVEALGPERARGHGAGRQRPRHARASHDGRRAGQWKDSILLRRLNSTDVAELYAARNLALVSSLCAPSTPRTPLRR